MATRRALTRVAAVLGADLSERLFPTTGPRIRDRTQAAIVEALLGVLDPHWARHLEVPVAGRARGVIDIVLGDPAAALLVACEIESGLRRLEQQIRWSHSKADALLDTDLARLASGSIEVGASISRLLIVRSTVATRDVVRAYPESLRSEFPARARDAYAALTGSAPWPGPALLWAIVDGTRATILDRPPRGIDVGR
jgi:hypothetical protein